MIPSEYVGPYTVSNLIAVVLLIIAWFWPYIARFAFALIFFAASIVNTIFVLRDPNSYVEFGELAVLDVYRDFIYGFFSEYTVLIVILIAIGQFTIATFLTIGRPLLSLGVLGGVIFLLAIIPLGIGSAFPCTLIMALGMGLMLWRLRDKAVLKILLYD